MVLNANESLKRISEHTHNRLKCRGKSDVLCMCVYIGMCAPECVHTHTHLALTLEWTIKLMALSLPSLRLYKM